MKSSLVLLYAWFAFCSWQSRAQATDSNGDPIFGTTVVNSSGLRGDIYLLPKDTMVLPDFRAMEPVGVIWTSTLDIPPRHWQAGFPGVTTRNEWFAINYTGKFWIEQPGRYKFALLSDDGSMLYIDDELIIDNDCQHPPDVRAASVFLSGGIHRIRIPYFQGPRDCLALILTVARPDDKWEMFSTENFKPPASVDDWKYGSLSDLTKTQPDQTSTGVRDVIKTAGEEGMALPHKESEDKRHHRHRSQPSANGCMYAPVHNCGR